MKALVAYSSQTGNTKKLAEALYNALPCEKDIRPITDDLDPTGYKLIAVGFWMKGEGPEPAVMKFLPKIGEKEVFLFATHGAAKDSVHVKDAMKKAKKAAHGARIMGTYTCQGEVDQKVMDAAAAKDPRPAWFAEAASAKGHPNDEDIREMVQLFNALGLV